MNRTSADFSILFSTRSVRLFAYGFLSVILALYLADIGLDEKEIGLLFSLTLLGDALVSFWLTTQADRIGRRITLIAGAVLMMLSGAAFAATSNRVLLVTAAIVGVISPSGKEIGPFLSVEQAALSQLVPDVRRTHVFAWYNLAGSLASAAGALAGGLVVYWLRGLGLAEVDAFRILIVAYAAVGFVLALLFVFVSPAIEAPRPKVSAASPGVLGLHRSKGVVLRMSALFGVDAFAGGFIVQSLIAYWLRVKFGASAQALGAIFFGTNLVAGVSALYAARIAKRIGLVNTMVFTHIPSNVLLCLVPLAPTLPLAVALLVLRFSISQMDVPTRQSYTMAVVDPDERSAASGVTTIARSVGASVSPAMTGVFLANPALLGLPFYLAGGLKIVYDLLVYRAFRHLKPPEER